MQIQLPIICCFMFSMSATATTISLNELPTDMYDCFQRNDCVTALDSNGLFSSTHDVPGAAAFSYYRVDQDPGWRWLMRYELQAPPGTIGGIGWLTARAQYDVQNSNSHDFTLYYSGSVFDNSPITLTMTSADLAAGSGYHSTDYDAGTSEGNLQINPWPDVVIETSYQFSFNLLYMHYTNGNFAFNAVDTRDLLYSQRTDEWTPGGSQEYTSTYESLMVTAVPLPTAVWLFMGGVGLLVGLGHRDKKCFHPTS